MRTSKNLMIVVDDDADDRMLCQEYLGRLANGGHELVMLSSGEELFQYLDNIAREDELPRLVLMDYNMPRMTGGEILLQLRKQARYASLKVALYSSGMSPELQQCMVALQAAHCFNKPVSVDEFTQMSAVLRSIMYPESIHVA